MCLHLCLLATLSIAPPLAARDDGVSDPAASGNAFGTSAEFDVVPTGDWLRVDDVEWKGQPIEIHLRTGYERPLILPEPVRPMAGQSLSGGGVTIDVELVLFAPREHFLEQDVVLVGERSGTRYRLAVRSDAFGSRVPLRIVRR